MPYPEIDPAGIKTYRAIERTSKVSTALEGKSPYPGMSMKSFLDGLPSVLKANDLKSIALAVVKAKRLKKPVIVMIGGHVIKTGCSPILADLATNGYIQHIAANGSAAVHDVELSFCGQTSEDVAAQLADGSFGMASDTAEVINSAAKRAFQTLEGFGESLGSSLVESEAPNLGRSLASHAFRLKIPFTLHVALGTDIVHQHPSASGSAIGEATLRDFRIFAASVARLGQGGVLLNFGSAVIMPEIFLKALTLTRNLGHAVNDFTTANFDIIQHYRPTVNIVQRPVLEGGRGYALTGHHEIMLPLLAAAIYAYA